jgi:murein DD-endopeptidase MepM/ murein hydrolase activator NlpD
MRIVAKETLLFPSMAKQLRSLSNTFSRFVKLHNIQPAVGGQISDLTKSLSESKEIKVANIKVKKYGKEKKRTFLAGILDKLVTLIKLLFIGTLLSVGYIVYKVTEIITPYVEDLISKVKEGIGFISDGVKSLYENTDWLDLFESSFKKYLSFLSFGLISEEQVGSYIGQAGSFYKEMIKGIGRYIEMAVEWLSPRLQQLGRMFAKDVLGVDVDKLEERRSIREVLVKRSKELEEEYANLDREDKNLTEKRDTLSKEKQKIEEEKKKKEKEEREKDLQRRVKEKEEEEKKKPFLQRLFKREEKKLPPIEERSITEKPVTEKPTPAPLPPSTSPSTQKENAIPQKPTAEKQKEEKMSEGSGDIGMKYSEGSNVVKINSKYGMRQLPGESKPRLHGGIDYAAPLGMPITFQGSKAKVIRAGTNSGYGRVIDLSVEGEVLRFAHLSKMLVKDGDVITRGMTLGLVGGSNKVNGQIIEGGKGAYGPHLHFEHRSSVSFDGKDTFDPVKSGATRMISFGEKIAASDYSVTEQYADYKGSFGQGLDSESSKIALAYREQSKPQNPTYIAARTTNNVVAETKRTNVAVPA